MNHKLEKKLNYQFRDQKNLIHALTHKSYSHENKEKIEHNERLEFLGDAILDLVLSEHLYLFNSEKREGELSRIRASLVNELSLSEIAKTIGLGNFLLLGKGEEKTGGRSKNSILADALEALIAAVYLDGGLESAKSVIKGLFLGSQGVLENSPKEFDYKTRLQEHSQRIWRTIPQYEILDETGPDHEKTFSVKVKVGEKILAKALGRSKKDAEQNAARRFLENENL